MHTANTHNWITTITITIAMVLLPSTPLYAEELDSTNYKLIGVTTSSGSSITSTSDYSLLMSIGEISANPRTYSTNYQINSDPAANFVAAIPSIQCLETTSTNTTTSCTKYTTGMNAVCGKNGCYDRARIEIEPNGNPTDTLYSIQISTDNFVGDINCIDASSSKPKNINSCTINDFRTEANWEQGNSNITGLIANTQYYVRITALQGDFTQSEYSQISTVNTGLGSLSFDIDIANSNGTTAETGTPYSISFTGTEKLIAGAAPTISSKLIWLDLESSALGGTSIIVSGKNGGLYSTTTGEKIPSVTGNLTTMEGYGLRSNYITSDTSSGNYSTLSANTSYTSTDTTTVGEVPTNGRVVYTSTGPIVAGRMGLTVVAKANTTRAAADDYTEKITFTILPIY